MPTTKLKRAVVMRSGGTPAVDDPSMWTEDGLPWVSIADMSKAPTVVRTDRCVSSTGVAAKALPVGQPGTLLFAMYASVGTLGTLGIEASWNQAILGMDARPDRAHARFVHYWLEHIKPDLLSITRSNTQDNLNAEQVGNAPFPVLPVRTQRAIANYLDRETVRIDRLIFSKQRMIALLQEKRRNLITQYATRGCELAADFTDSGLAWLGSIPSHWQLSKFTRSILVAEGQVDPEHAPYSNMSLVAPNHIESGTGLVLGRETASDQGAISGKYLCRTGDVIYSKIRPALSKAVIASEDCLCSADMYALRVQAGLNSEYLLYFILSGPFTTWAVLESERVAMPKINREALADLRIPVPPLEEQRQIVTNIEAETSKLDKMRSTTERSISLLREHRRSLITAAVTGQLEIPEAA